MWHRGQAEAWAQIGLDLHSSPATHQSQALERATNPFTHGLAQNKHFDKQNKPASWSQAPEDRCSPSEREPAPLLPPGTSGLEGSGSQPLPQLYHSEALKPQLTLNRKEPHYHILSLWGLGRAEDREGLGGEARRGSRMGLAKAWHSPPGQRHLPGHLSVPVMAMELPSSCLLVILTSSPCPLSTS